MDRRCRYDRQSIMFVRLPSGSSFHGHSGASMLLRQLKGTSSTAGVIAVRGVLQYLILRKTVIPYAKTLPWIFGFL